MGSAQIHGQGEKIMLRTRFTSVGVLAAGLLGLGCLVASQPATAASRAPAASPLIGGYKVVTVTQTANAGAVSTATAACPSPKDVVGGGASGSANIGHLENIQSSYPSGTAAWTATVTNTDSVNGTFTVYAICATVHGAYGTVFGQAVESPSGSQTGAVADCPTTTSALSGGGYNTLSVLGVDLNLEEPLAASPSPIDGFGSDTNNTSSSDDNATQAVAVCMTTPQGYEVVTGSNVTVPAQSQGSTSVSCPSGTVVTGGGVFDQESSDTVDLNASFPAGETAWDIFENNPSSFSDPLTGYAICAKP
jgi:hypothetical protein